MLITQTEQLVSVPGVVTSAIWSMVLPIYFCIKSLEKDTPQRNSVAEEGM